MGQDLFVQKMLDMTSCFVPGDAYMPLQLDRGTLLDLDPDEVFIVDTWVAEDLTRCHQNLTRCRQSLTRCRQNLTRYIDILHSHEVGQLAWVVR